MNVTHRQLNGFNAPNTGQNKLMRVRSILINIETRLSETIIGTKIIIVLKLTLVRKSLKRNTIKNKYFEVRVMSLHDIKRSI